LAPTLQKVAPKGEATEMQALKMQLQSTLCKAATEGRLAPTLQRVAPRTADPVEAMREMARQAVSKAAASGALTSTFREAIRNSKLAVAPQVPVPPAAVTPAPPAESVSAAPKMPATPTRSHRRIIGGVVRTPSAMELDLEFPSASPPVPSASPPSLSERKTTSKSSSKKVAKSFRLDLDDDCEDHGPSSSSWNRASSLTRGYDTLGSQCQFHVINDSPSSSSAPKTMLAPSKLETAFDRPSSKASARLRAASTSAMAMDLGGGFTSSHLSGFRFAPKALGMEGQTLRQSASLGSLQTAKVSKLPGGLLPMLTTKKMSGESIAWSMHMSKNGCANTGLRASASMVF